MISAALLLACLTVGLAAAQQQLAFTRALHAVPDAPAVDVFVGPGSDPTWTSLAFGSATDFLPVAPGYYQVMVVLSATKTVILNLTSVYFSTNETIIVIVDPNNETQFTALVQNDAKPGIPYAGYTATRFLHLIPDAPPVALFVNSNIDSALISYTQTCPSAPGAYQIVPAGSAIVSLQLYHSVPPKFVLSKNISTVSGQAKSIYAIGSTTHSSGPFAIQFLELIDSQQ